MWFTPSTRYTFSRKNPTTEREKDMNKTNSPGAPFFDFEELCTLFSGGTVRRPVDDFEPDPDFQVKAMKEDALTD